MPTPKILEREVWCKPCNTFYGKIYTQEIREGHHKIVTEPKKLITKCTLCGAVVTSKHATP